jgi:hypothetical protein
MRNEDFPMLCTIFGMVAQEIKSALFIYLFIAHFFLDIVTLLHSQ